MKSRLRLFRVKLTLSLKTLWWLFLQWRYLALSMLAAVAFFELIYWMFNLAVLQTIMTSPGLSVLEKLSVLVSPLSALKEASGALTLILMVLLALLQGLNIAALTYTMRHQQKVDAQILSGSTFTGLLAAIGLGCPSCGTSLLTPVIALFVSTGSATQISEQLTLWMLPLAIIISLYGLYVLGLRAATARAYRKSITFDD